MKATLLVASIFALVPVLVGCSAGKPLAHAGGDALGVVSGPICKGIGDALVPVSAPGGALVGLLCKGAADVLADYLSHLRAGAPASCASFAPVSLRGVPAGFVCAESAPGIQEQLDGSK